MRVVDLIIAVIVVLAGVWGFRDGLSLRALSLVGFGIGAVIGSRVAPLALDGGLRSPSAPIVALPGALLVGGLLAAALESVGTRIAKRRRARRRDVPALVEDVGGPLLGVCVALVAAWIVSAALGRIGSLRDPVRDSEILQQLNAVLPAPGPLLTADVRTAPADPFPRIDGPVPPVQPPSAAIRSDPQVRAAARSVVRLRTLTCDHASEGSGWIAAPGIVMTNAHVVAGNVAVVAQVGGEGRNLAATPIWFDPAHDIAILRVPALAHAPVLRLAARPKVGAAGAILGFPYGGPYRAEIARLGPTYSFSDAPIGRTHGGGGKVPSTSLLGRVRPGNSGGPVVDGRGRVLTMIFAGEHTGVAAYGVPASAIRAALRRSGAADGGHEVPTGRCE